MHRLRRSIGHMKRMNCWSYYVWRCNMILGGAWNCQFKGSWSNSFPLMSKGEEKQQRASKGFYKAIRGRVFPSMPKVEIVGNIVIDGKGIGKAKIGRKRKQRGSKGSRWNRGIRGLIQFAKEMAKGRAVRKSQGNRLKDKLNIWPRFVYVDEEPWNYVRVNLEFTWPM